MLWRRVPAFAPCVLCPMRIELVARRARSRICCISRLTATWHYLSWREHRSSTRRLPWGRCVFCRLFVLLLLRLLYTVFVWNSFISENRNWHSYLGRTHPPYLFLLRLFYTEFVLTSFIKHRTGTALPDDNGRTLVTTAPWSGGRETQLQTN